jgi:hypothetical protein
MVEILWTAAWQTPAHCGYNSAPGAAHGRSTNQGAGMEKDSETGPICEERRTASPRIDFQPNDWYTLERESGKARVSL